MLVGFLLMVRCDGLCSVGGRYLLVYWDLLNMCLIVSIWMILIIRLRILWWWMLVMWWCVCCVCMVVLFIMMWLIDVFGCWLCSCLVLVYVVLSGC